MQTIGEFTLANERFSYELHDYGPGFSFASPFDKSVDWSKQGASSHQSKAHASFRRSFAGIVHAPVR